LKNAEVARLAALLHRNAEKQKPQSVEWPHDTRAGKWKAQREQYMYGRGSGSEPPSTAERAEASEPPSPGATAPGAGLYEGSMSEAAEQAPAKPEQFSMSVDMKTGMQLKF
jgi:hypothetical protein